jgi:hypothetical protein
MPEAFQLNNKDTPLAKLKAASTEACPTMGKIVAQTSVFGVNSMPEAFQLIISGYAFGEAERRQAQRLALQ